MDGGWWMVIGGWWLLDGRWWMVEGGWWMVDGDWWMVDGERASDEIQSPELRTGWSKNIDIYDTSWVPIVRGARYLRHFWLLESRFHRK